MRALRRAVLGSTVLLAAAGALALGRGARLERADVAFVNGAEPSTLDPAAITAIPEGRIVRALFEGLVVRDPRTLAPSPGVAESWESTEDGLLWTFRLRTDARWTDGEPVTARDFAYSFERLLDPRTAAGYASALYCVEGAREFATDVDGRGAPRRSFESVGIRAEDDRTLAIRLAHPFPPFLDVLACPQLAPVSRRSLEAMRARFPATWGVEWLRPGNLVTNGPFRLLERRANDRIRLGRFEGYWDAANVAMETIDALAVEHVGTALNLYLTGEVAWVDRQPADLLAQLARREDFRTAPYLGTYFYRVNVGRPPFDDARVRRALALAIDREAIVAKVTRCGERPLFACVPAGFAEYRGPELRRAGTFAEDVEEARRLLAETGLAFPTIAIHYNTHELNRDVAEVIADSWRRNLGIRTRLENQEWKVFQDTQNRIAYDVSRSSWIADYADPWGFLEIFTTGNRNNRTGWGDARYDDLVRRAASAPEPERSELLREAEALLLEALPILPIFAYASKNLVDPRLEGFHENALDEHPPKAWRWKSE